jgi:hypothetical protein
MKKTGKLLLEYHGINYYGQDVPKLDAEISDQKFEENQGIFIFSVYHFQNMY